MSCKVSMHIVCYTANLGSVVPSHVDSLLKSAAAARVVKLNTEQDMLPSQPAEYFHRLGCTKQQVMATMRTFASEAGQQVLATLKTDSTL